MVLWISGVAPRGILRLRILFVCEGKMMEYQIVKHSVNPMATAAATAMSFIDLGV